ncbi:hypothetical protein LJ739_08340 [Aestuariibacter halophilus]|uniref:Uncharacterized protein n=1 Tax=Fluctibacter halophilus TaxID=226011 RepID=A0ABS8GAJ0_9ALTE|nr:hypothetical protein [Aestuariibacter halophilus]MCC2616246.1 hypothetical protein [Aestuariibacter halophilus]
MAHFTSRRNPVNPLTRGAFHLSYRQMAAIAMVFVLVACSDEPPAVRYGKPTPMQVNGSPLESLCAIQTAFLQLKTPLEESISRVPAWEETPMFAATTRYPEFHSVKLAPHALAFVQQHSVPELVASLSPLALAQDTSKQALTLLAGIPFASKNDKRRHTGSMADALMTRQRDANKSWQQQVGGIVGTAGPLYAGKFFHHLLTDLEQTDYQQTLEYHIRVIADEFRALPYSPLSLDGQGNHIINPKTMDFINRFRADPLATAATLPLVKGHSGSKQLTQPEVVMLLLTGAEHHAVINAFLNKTPEADVMALRAHYQQAAVSVCDGVFSHGPMAM